MRLDKRILLCLALALPACGDSAEEPEPQEDPPPFTCPPVEVDGCVLERGAVCSELVVWPDEDRLKCVDLRDVTCTPCYLRAETVLLNDQTRVFGGDPPVWGGSFVDVHAPNLDLEEFNTFNATLAGELLNCNFAGREFNGSISGNLSGCDFRETHFTGGRIGGDIRNADFRGAVIDSYILYGSQTEGSLWDGATCRNGYVIPEGSGKTCLPINKPPPEGE